MKIIGECPKCQRPLREYQNECECAIKRVIKVDQPEDGYGTFTYLENYVYPYKGYPNEIIVNLNATAKRALIATLKLFSKKPFIYFSPFFLLLPKKLRKRAYYRLLLWAGEILDTAFRIHYPSPTTRLCRASRELLRVGMNMVNKYSSEKDKQFFRGLAMGAVMVLEYDNAYRYRAQDIIPLFNKDNLKKNPRKELIRVLEIALEREQCLTSPNTTEVHVFSVGDKWKLLLRIAKIFLFFDRIPLKFIQEILLDINQDEVKLDVADWYWVCERYDYNYGGKTFEERAKERYALEKREQGNILKLPPEQPMVAMMPNKLFYHLSRAKAEKLIADLTKQVIDGYTKFHEMNPNLPLIPD